MDNRAGYDIREIRPSDNFAVAQIIKTVMPEFGAGGPGFAIHDEEVTDMFGAYSLPRSAYYVCEIGGEVVGGGGVAPLAGGESHICELKKMYFLPAGRGKGLGQQVLDACLSSARSFGYHCCYLETFRTMTGAMKLYERNQFLPISGPLGNTGHFGCDIFYQLAL